jgi:hypothetical protein
MIIMAGISTIILGVVSAQMVPTYVDQKGTKTIYSAQAGIQSALSIFRAAGTVDGSGKTYGDPSKLPCSFTGLPNGTADGNGYAVVIKYYTTDPTGASPTAALTCSTTGTYGNANYGLASTAMPKYALITSTGTATQIAKTTGVADRAITALYTFEVSNVNVLGGVIFNSGSTACMQAVTAAKGSFITFVAASSCGANSAKAALQLFSYTSSWQLALASTTVGGVPGLCITGATPAKGKTSANATLQPCATDSSRWNQLWSWTGSYTWEGETQAIDGPDANSWLSPSVPDGTSPIGTFLQNSQSVTGTMAPTAQVGAGAASYTTHQLVNYLEFGRCADVTNERVDWRPAMISYPCKQDPTGGTTYITWNQKWFYCEPGDTAASCNTVNPLAQPIYVNNTDGNKWCLTTPATGGGAFPLFQLCTTTGTNGPLQVWSRYYDTGTYSTSYVMEDKFGRCLEASSADQFAGATGISELTVAGCDGSLQQKWNAPPTYQKSNLGGYREISAG